MIEFYYKSWDCADCGWRFVGAEAPAKCKACKMENIVKCTDEAKKSKGVMFTTQADIDAKIAEYASGPKHNITDGKEFREETIDEQADRVEGELEEFKKTLSKTEIDDLRAEKLALSKQSRLFPKYREETDGEQAARVKQFTETWQAKTLPTQEEIDEHLAVFEDK